MPIDQLHWQTIEKIFYSAIELAPGERASFLDTACSGDVELRAEVESLLAETAREDSFFGGSYLSLGFTLIADEKGPSLVGKTFGPYKIIRQLGHGGMGEVYLAEDVELERLTALKVLLSHVSEKKSIVRFEHEARAASAITHPNVAHIYRIGEEDGRMFIAMEFIDGNTLRAQFSSRRLTLGEAVDISIQIAEAIEAAHRVGIVHRDIKPENIMVRRDGVVKVVDFGLAKLVPHSADLAANQTQPGTKVTRVADTEPGVLMGTANYMSPEQARGQDTDTCTDIWSWGIVFYEMLVGKVPFTGATNSDVIAEILKGALPPLPLCFPAQFNRLLEKTLNKDKSKRYTGTELLARMYELRSEIDPFQLSLPLPAGEHLSKDDTPAFTDPSRAVIPTKKPLHFDQTDGDERSITNREAGLSGEDSARTVPSVPRKRRVLKAGLVGSGLMLFLALSLYGIFNLRGGPRQNNIAALQITELTKDGRIMDAAISQDARLLAYVPIESGKQSLWIRNLETMEEIRLTESDLGWYWGMRFTPDGKNLLYLRTEPDSSLNILYLTDLKGTHSKVVANIVAPPAVSPDGTQVAFVRPYPSQDREALLIVNIDGSGERELLSRQHPDGFKFSGASWSPDGKQVTLGTSRKRTENTIISVPVTGEPPVELTPWQWSDIGGMVWDKDGRNLFFSARASGARVFRIWKLSSPRGPVDSVTDEEKSYDELTLAHAGNVLAATRTYEVSDIWSVGRSGTIRRLTTQGEEGADGMVLSPAAGRIIYTHGEYEQSFLWSMNMDGSDRKKLTENTGFLPSTSKNTRLVAYVSVANGIHHIWLTNVDGNDNRQLTNGGGENYPSITPDGNWVVYTSIEKGQSTLWKIPVGGGPAVPLTTTGITIKPVVSRDGTMIACTYRKDETDEWKIVVLPMAGGPHLRTFDLPRARFQMVRWSPDSRSLIFLNKINGAQNLWLQPLDGSPPSQLTNFTEDMILHHDLSDSGDEYIISRGGRRRDIELIRNY